MIRRIRKTPQLELSLVVSAEDFIRPPRDAQRNWLVNRSLKEAVEDLNRLHELAARFVPGTDPGELQDRSTALLGDDDIMEDWQIPLMEAMVEVAGARGRDLLEVGFGRGVAAELLQAQAPASHTVVECNPSVLERAQRWRAGYPDRDIRLVPGRWQEVEGELGRYNVIFFHTYPLSMEEYLAQVVHSSTFAEHFFPAAARLLRPGGRLVYPAYEIDSLSRAHQRALLERFSSFSVQRVGLTLPANVRDAWWADSMMIVEARS